MQLATMKAIQQATMMPLTLEAAQAVAAAVVLAPATAVDAALTPAVAADATHNNEK